MKKHFIRAFVVGLVFVAVYYVFQIVQGMYLTWKYVPDIVESYESAGHLQQQVSFGVKSSPIWMVEIPGLMLLGIAVYYGVRKIRGKK